MKKSSLYLCTLIILLSSFVLAGCGGKAKETSAPSTNQPTASTQVSEEASIDELFTKGQKLEGISYDCVVSDKGNVQLNSKVWVQGTKMKFEADVDGEKMFTIIDGDSVIGYNPEDKTAYKLSMDQANQSKTPSDYLEEANSQVDRYKSLETVIYDGVKCRVISLTSPDGKDLSKMWVREDYGIPVKVEAIGPDGSTSVLEYKNMKIGPLPEDTFKLPEGVQITDISELTKQFTNIEVPKSN